MAEQFNMEFGLPKSVAKELSKIIKEGTKISIDISTEFVDLYIGPQNFRWARKDGKLI
jgi:hypothetical protein